MRHELPTIPPDPAGFDFLVIGAGVAGLSAAVELCRAGARPLVLEAAPTAGGRARSFWDRESGEELDCGPHLLVGAYRATLELLEQLATRHLLLAGDGYHFWTPETGNYCLRFPRVPAPLHAAVGLARLPGVGVGDWWGLARLGHALLTTPTAELEFMSVTNWLERLRQPPELFRNLWEPLCLATLNEPPGSANAALFASVARRLLLEGRDEITPLLPRVPLTELLSAPAVRLIERHGGRVVGGCRVTGLALAGEWPTRIFTRRGELAWQRPVICALPHWEARKLLAGVGFSLPELSHSPIVGVHLSYPCPVSLPAPMVGMPGAVSQWLFDRNAVSTTPGVDGRVSAALSAAYREVQFSSAELAAAVHADVVRLVPGLAGITPRAARVIKEHRATLAAWPGVNRHRPTPAATACRGLLLAGEWTATGLPGTLEGAVISGCNAAQMALEYH